MNKETIWSRGFILSCIACFFLFANFYMLLSAMPMAIQLNMNGTLKDMSLVVSIYIFGIVLLRPFSGLIADKIGKKRVSTLSLLLFLICTIGYLGLNTILPLLIVRFIHGVVHSSSTTAHAALAIEMLPSSKKGQGVGYYSLSMSLSMVLGPALGIFLLNNFGYNTLIIVAGVFSLISWLATVFTKEAHANIISDEKELEFSDFIEPRAIPVCLAALTFSFGYSSLISFMATFTKSINAPEAAMYFFIAFAISIMATRPTVGKLLDEKGPSFLLFPTIILFALGVFTLSFSSSVWFVVIIGFIMGFAYGAIFPSLQTITIKLSSPNKTGVATATFFLFWDIGFGLGSFILAIVASALGYAGMFQVVSGVAILSLILFYFLYHRPLSNNSLN